MSALLNSEVGRVQRRTIVVLSASNAFGAVGMTIGVATASLLAKEVSGKESLAGLAQTFQMVGAGLAAYLLAQVMDRSGRRAGLSLGLALGSLGALLMVVASGVGSMALLLIGALLLGATSASGLSARYAATDLADEGSRARALSIVVWMSTIGAVLGPNLSAYAQRLGPVLGVPDLAGSFALGGVAMAIGAGVAWVWLRPDPLLVARARDADQAGVTQEQAAAARAGRGNSWVLTLAEAKRQPSLAAAILALAAAHAVMVSVMVMTPLHMAHGGATLRVIGLVISIHILGMFVFAPVVGWACDRFGKARVLQLGAAVLLGACALAGTAPSGHSDHITAGLFLLGVGWSLSTVAASAIIVDLTPGELRTDVQGVADLCMQFLAAIGAALSGVVVGAAGYPTLAMFAAAISLGVVVASFVVRRASPR